MKKKIVGCIHQPTFIPWLGLIEKIYRSDIFIVFDTSTVRKNSVINRNKIKTPQGAIWLTVPIHATLKTPVNKMKIDNSQNWQQKHLKSLFFNYKKAKNFAKIYPKIEKIYLSKWENLSDFNLALIKFILRELKIKRKIVRVSSLKVKGAKNEILIDMLKKTKVGIYYSGKGSRGYLDEKLFKKNGIEVIWQEFKSPPYDQLWGKFMPNLSAIDFLMCEGRKDIFR